MAKSVLELETELLVLRSQDGDAEAFGELVELWTPRVFAYARSLADSDGDALDLVQETWLGVVKGLGRLRFPEAFAAWLFRIAGNRRASGLRKALRKADDVSLAAGAGSENDETALSELVRKETRETVHAVLDLLSVDHRAVLFLFYFEEFSTSQIAAILRIPEGTVKSRLFHARRGFRAIWEKNHER